jgi:hypothetical protein
VRGHRLVAQAQQAQIGRLSARGLSPRIERADRPLPALQGAGRVVAPVRRPATMWTVEDQERPAKALGTSSPMRTKSAHQPVPLRRHSRNRRRGIVALLVRAFVNTAGKCEAGWAGGVGLSVSFMAGGRAGSLSGTAPRHPSETSVSRDRSTPTRIDSPGVLSSPVIVTGSRQSQLWSPSSSLKAPVDVA